MDAIFHRRDILVHHAHDGVAALERIGEESYDAMVLDLMLPGTNGFQVIRELKKRDPKLLRRTIVLTAASKKVLRQFEDAPLVRRVMKKPFDVAELVAAVLSCGTELQTGT